jgi:hypothetical protein
MSQNPKGRVWSGKPGIANKEEIQAVHKWLRDQRKVEGIRKLVDRWIKCIEKEGDYVEK